MTSPLPTLEKEDTETGCDEVLESVMAAAERLIALVDAEDYGLAHAFAENVFDPAFLAMILAGFVGDLREMFAELGNEDQTSLAMRM